MAKFGPCADRQTRICKSQPGGAGFEDVRGSWRAAEGRHCVGIHEESPGQAASEPVVGAEESSILEMAVLWDNHPECQHQWSGANQSLEASYLYCRGQAGEVMQVLMGSQAQGSLEPCIQVYIPGTHWGLQN